MTENRKGAWDEVHTIPEPNTGLTVVIKERIRGRPAYSWQIVHTESDGKRNSYLPWPIRGLDKIEVEGDVPVQVEDVLRALTVAAREWIEAKLASNKPKPKPRSDKPKGKGKDRRDEKRGPGGLTALAKADAAAGGHEHKSKTQKRRERREKARTDAKAETS